MKEAEEEGENIEEGSGDRNDPDREAGHGEQRQRAASSGAAGKLEEEEDEEALEEMCVDDEDELNESKKSLKTKLKKARRQNDRKEARRIKKHLNESKTLKDDLVRRKSTLNERLMQRWFGHKE